MTPMKKVSIEVSMRNLKPTDGSSITKHINTLQSTQQEVLAGGKIIDSADMALTPLSHLPKSYSSFYSSLITSGRANTILWEELVPMVIDEEENHKRYSSNNAKSEAFAGGNSQGGRRKKQQQQGKQGQQQQQRQQPSNGGRNQSSTNNNTKKERKCYICDKTNHIAKDCPDKKRGTTSSSSVARTSVFVHLVELEDLDSSLSSEVGLQSAPRGTRTWVVDSRASQHMTPIYLHLRHGDVTTGDNSNTPIHGIGEMQLISDGKGGFYISQVLYVPSLGFHLLLVSQLCKLGLMVEFSKDHFWIWDKESRAVVCKGKGDHGLYKLRDTRTLSLYLSPSNVLELWHAKFGHLNYVYLRLAFKDGLSDVFVTFKAWMTMVELESKTIRADKGGEFTSLSLKKLCAEKGIKQEFANTGTPWENGVVECKNRTIVEMARTMFEHRDLPQELWDEANATAVHISNRSPSQATPGTTLYEAYFRKKPDGCRLRRGTAFRGGTSTALGESEGNGSLEDIRHQQIPDTPPAASEDVPSTETGCNDLADEDVELPTQDVEEEIASKQFPTWARQTRRESGIEGVRPEWERADGPRRSHWIRQQHRTEDELLQVNYLLMSRIEKDQEPTHVGEALRQEVWKKAMEEELASI
ncbi:hypothetical protein L7F22_046338 [Adiantum nelumboides]|nr:hypothetical protein [Adiantum nelumboides]